VENRVENFGRRAGSPDVFATDTGLHHHGATTGREERDIIPTASTETSIEPFASRDSWQLVLRFAVPVVVPTELARSTRSARTVAVIPARYQSTRLPGKPLATIQGRTMIEHVYRAASSARTVDVVLVATDDQRIADAVTAFGGVAVMTSAAHRTGTDRLAEVASGLDSEVVVNVQGDEPLILSAQIDAAVHTVLDHPDEVIGTLRCAVRNPADLANPAVVKVVVDATGHALYFSRAPIPHVRTDADRPTVWKHVGLYAYRRDFLLTIARLAQTPLERAESLEQLRVLEHGYRIATVETHDDTIGVDTPEDLDRVRRLVEAATHA
jgi:3-deoxy-manno-octulosonate cytidylyltransferase (CMP-KDO synthetase)